MAKKKSNLDPEGIQTIAENRRARRDYEIVETLEGGLVLTGTEVKSLRQKNVSFADAYALVKDHEVFLIGLTIDPYKHGNIFNHEPDRTRKVLLKTAEIERIEKMMQRQKVQLIPLKLYFKKGWAKVLLGVGKGKSTRDKRDDIKKREADRDIRRALKRG